MATFNVQYTCSLANANLLSYPRSCIGREFCFRNLYFYFWLGESTSTASQKSKDLNKVSLLYQDLAHTPNLEMLLQLKTRHKNSVTICLIFAWTILGQVKTCCQFKLFRLLKSILSLHLFFTPVWMLKLEFILFRLTFSVAASKFGRYVLKVTSMWCDFTVNLLRILSRDDRIQITHNFQNNQIKYKISKTCILI